MWGRSLYQNITTFLTLSANCQCCGLFPRTCWCVYGYGVSADGNADAVGKSYMDTFAAMALASLPPSEKVMKDSPRDRNAFIINRSMGWNIIGVGWFLLCVAVGIALYLRTC